MFEKLTKETKEHLCAELMKVDEVARVVEKTHVTVIKVGEVAFTTPAGTNKLPVKVHDGSFDHGDGALCKFASGEVTILFSQQIYSTLVDELFYSTLAHEIGHFLCNHLNMKDFDIPNKLEKENRLAIKNGDQEKHNYYGTMGVLDGGYLTREFEADVVACRFVGLKDIAYMHAISCVDFPNILAKMENINRLAALKEKFGEGYTGDPDFVLSYIHTHQTNKTESKS